MEHFQKKFISHFLVIFKSYHNIMKRNFKYWWSTIPSCTKIQTTIINLKSLTMTYEDGNPTNGLGQAKKWIL